MVGEAGRRRDNWIINYSAPPDTDNNIVSTGWASFRAAVWLNETLLSIYQSSAHSDGRQCHRFTQNVIALFHIQGTRRGKL